MDQLDSDLNKDGKVSEKEVDLLARKMASQRRMAWVALSAIVIFTTVLFTPMVAETRVAALGDLIGLFYISMAGIVGAYMGVTAWMSRK